MRVKCPYCDGAFAVYPIPIEQAVRHRRAGYVAAVVAVSLAGGVCAVLGADVVGAFVRRVADLLGGHVGMGVVGAVAGVPGIFVSLAIYDRLVPHVGAGVRCVEFGQDLSDPNGPRNPRSDEPNRSDA